MDDSKVVDNVTYIEAGQSAVRLLKVLASMIPLRSDIPKIRDEIGRLEKVFGDMPASTKIPAQDGFDSFH